MRNYFIKALAGFAALALFKPLQGQVSVGDTVKAVVEDTVFIQKSERHYGASATAIKFRERYSAANKTALTSLVNSIPGVRMEERSPGSYRLNLRGSSLRSPFGVRNVKVFWNGLPLTDPGGNTYFNQVAATNFTSITIEKSTTSPLYGSGTGGQVRIDNIPSKKDEATIELVGSSYHGKAVLVTAGFGNKTIRNKFGYTHNDANGYREQSAMRRDNLSWTSNIQLTARQRLDAGILFTDIYYQTPGALTLVEYQANPKLARPASGIFPSAVNAKAAIFQKNLTAGIVYSNQFASGFSNKTTVYGSYNRIENSAVRNYEMRNEPHYGGRTVFALNKKFDNGNRLDWLAGSEVQAGKFNIKVFGNKAGNPDTVQTNDDVNTITYSVFSELSFSLCDNWYATASLSYNKTRVAFERLSDDPVLQQPFSFSNELVPRAGISRRWGAGYSLSGLVSKSFSPPTVAELLPSTGIINTTLQAEKGWNYELIAKLNPAGWKWSFETSLFHFGLKDALVQRRDEAGADYFTNAGGTKQEGVEVTGSYSYTRSRDGFWEDGKISASYSHSHFKYVSFIKDETDFSGKTLPGIPRSAIYLEGDAYFRNGAYCIVSYYGASPVFLNDANSAAAKPYHILTAKLGYALAVKRFKLNLYGGADNLFNENYSLGNDINAAAGRYYNAAPRRNYYIGAALKFKKRGTD